MNARAVRLPVDAASVLPRAARGGGDGEGFLALARELLRDGLISDPWCSGAPRFAPEPFVISQGDRDQLYVATSRVARAYDEAMRICTGDPTLLNSFYHLTPWQESMALASLPLWHGIARADVFRTSEGGIKICELNADTPTGEPEAVVLGALARGPGLIDPNCELAARFVSMVEAMTTALLPNGAPRTAAIIYPTEITEDLAVVRLYGAWLVRAGWRVVVGSPFNVTRGGDGVPCVFGVPCSLVLRHYKTDWWGERLPVFRNAPPFPSADPLVDPLLTLLSAAADRKCVVVNPFGAVLAQNKRTMALFWEQLPRFSPASQQAIRSFIPYTVRLETVGVDALRDAREEWVLKSDYGCEGDEVLVGRHVADADWQAALDHAIPERWIAQRRFDVATATSGESVNYGVYIVAGAPSGLYARVQRGPTDVHAKSVPLLVRSRQEAP